jgi:hypothetical protein
MTLFDQFAVAAPVLIVVFGGMRLIYGAWPWEADKTWYRTRAAVDYVAAVRSKKKCNPTLQFVWGTIDTGTRPLMQDGKNAAMRSSTRQNTRFLKPVRPLVRER